MPALAPENQRPRSRNGFLKPALVFLLALTLFPAATSADEKRLSVYSSVARYSLPVIDRGGQEYVGLLELLEPLGRVSAEKIGPRWKLRYNAIESEFVPGRTRAKIGGRNFDLPLPFLVENSRGFVPVSSLSTLLPRFLGTPVNFRESARRLLIGDVAIQSSILLDPSTPPRLVLNFTAPVNPIISTEPGKLHMLFKRDPVVPPGGQSISFNNQIITQVGYSENNGAAELDVSANAPLMASFSNGGRTITVAAVPQPPTAGAGPSPPTSPSAPTPSNPVQPTPAGRMAPAPSGSPSRRVLAVVDAAHGGNERGAALTDTLAEKDVTLGFARLLRHELEQRGFSVVLLRDADINLTLDQRAGAANAARAGIYIGLHAASQGTGARVYTSLLPVEGENKGTFHAWNVAQAPALPVSRLVAAAIVTEMEKRQLPARGSSASLRPLNNVLMPALAVELAPGPSGVADLPSANYQQQVAAAIADAVAPFRDRMGVQP
jgi:N-acetylmuramoyl-L-alanine amidase